MILAVRPLLIPAILAAMLLSAPAGAQALYAGAAQAKPAAGMQQIQRVHVSGNKRMNESTVLSYLSVKPGDAVNASILNSALKDMYATGFFANIRMRHEQSDLYVEIEENPSINRILFEGNDQLEEDALRAELSLQPRSIYTPRKAQEDLERLEALYRKSGRYSTKITSKLTHHRQNRVDITYKIEEGQVARINNIRFIGNERYGDDTLREVVASSEECWYCVFSNNDAYDAERLEYDKELLRRFYTSQGYADFAVETAVAEMTPDKKNFLISFTINEGERYSVDNVRVDSSGVRYQGEQPLKSLLLTKKGDTYNSEMVEGSIDAVVEALGDKGYAFVNVRPRLVRNRENGTLDIVYKLEQGSRIYVERINITGNVRTLDEVVRREFRLTEGDPYNASKLRRTEQRLKNLGFFEDVKITQEPGSTPDRMIINVAVKEASTGELSLGAGYSTVDGVLTDVGVQERNLLGKGQNLRFKALFATERQQFDIGFTEPYFLNREISAGFDLFKIDQDFRTESSFDRQSVGGRLRLGYAITERLSHQTRYSLEQVSINNISPQASRFIRDQEGERMTSLVGHTLTYDARDNVFEPTEGYLLRLTQDVAGLGGDSKFFRNEADASYYYSIAPEWVLMLAASGGHVLPLEDDIRINDRFFIGGRTMRGFNNAGIGPRDIVSLDALGGNTYYTSTAELMFPLGLPNDLGINGAVFADVGSLYGIDEQGPEVADSSNLRASAGVGLAWSSPFGPIRIDFAHAFLKETYDDTELVRFNFGTRF